MKQILQILTIFFIFFTISLTVTAQDPFENCKDGATAGMPQFSGIDTVFFDSTTSSFTPEISQMAIDLNATGDSGFDNYAFVITGPPAWNGKNPIVDVTYDGTWDFGQSNLEPEPYGEYCFTGFGYNQADLDAATNNIIVRSILNQCCPSTADCIGGGEELDDILNVLINLEESTCEGGDSSTVYDIDTVVSILREDVSVAIGFTPCVKLSPNSYCVQYADIADRGTAISEFSFLGFEGIYPNPVVNEATVVFNAGEHDFVNVEIYNLTGQRIYGDGYLAEPGKNEYRIDVSNWNQGYYFIKLDDGKEVITKRMIVNH